MNTQSNFKSILAIGVNDKPVNVIELLVNKVNINK